MLSFIVIGALFNGAEVFADGLGSFITIPSNGNIKTFYISQYPVTNAQYKMFADDMGTPAPKYWKNGAYPQGKENHPVIFVSYNNALAY